MAWLGRLSARKKLPPVKPPCAGGSTPSQGRGQQLELAGVNRLPIPPIA